MIEWLADILDDLDVPEVIQPHFVASFHALDYPAVFLVFIRLSKPRQVRLTVEPSDQAVLVGQVVVINPRHVFQTFPEHAIAELIDDHPSIVNDDAPLPAVHLDDHVAVFVLRHFVVVAVVTWAALVVWWVGYPEHLEGVFDRWEGCADVRLGDHRQNLSTVALDNPHPSREVVGDDDGGEP